jgi:hypothetical protein
VNVLAMMGRSKSGKDTVGGIAKEVVGNGGVVTMAFADKLKLMCMDLYGLSYDDVFTDAGKDRVTDFVCWKCPACSSIDCFDEVADRTKRVVCRKCTAVGQPESFESKWTVRMILQHVGTEGCRRIDPNVWVNFTMRTAQAALEGRVYVTPIALADGSTYALATERMHNLESVPATAQLVVITDCRFRSEMVGVQKAEGSVWRLRRPETDRKAQGIASHASENEMDQIPDSMFQRVIVNDGTLDLLRSRVKESLQMLMRQNDPTDGAAYTGPR